MFDFARSGWKSVVFALILIVMCAIYYSFERQRKTSLDPRLITEEVQISDITEMVQAAGVLQPRVKVDVSAQVSGQVEKIHVHLGQQVKRGDVLVSLNPEFARNDVYQAEAALAQQAALIESRQADLKLARSELGRLQRLLAGEAAAATDFERAEVELLKVQADLRGQTANLKRLQAELDKRRLVLGYSTITAPIKGQSI